VKWWLLAIPHYLVIGLFLGGVGYAVGDTSGAVDDVRLTSSGLIGLLVLVAAVVLLFTGRYPQPVFDLVLGLNRWVLRVAAYAALMTDRYPPFRLDQGGDDPSTALLSAPATPSGAAVPPAGPAVTPDTRPGTPGGAPPPPPPGAGGPSRQASPPTRDGWTTGRVVGAVLGSLMLLGSLGLAVPGIALLVADNAARDADGFLMSDRETLSSTAYAITSDNIEIHAAAAAASVPGQLLGDARITVTPGTDRPVFVGIAPTADVTRYLGGARHAMLVDLSGGPWNRVPRYEVSGQGAPSAPPTGQDFWDARATGTGPQALTWSVDRGDWTVVVMNADGSPGVDVDVAVGATVPALGWLVGILLGLAAVGLVVSILVLTLVVRGATRARRTATGEPGTA